MAPRKQSDTPHGPRSGRVTLILGMACLLAGCQHAYRWALSPAGETPSTVRLETAQPELSVPTTQPVETVGDPTEAVTFDVNAATLPTQKVDSDVDTSEQAAIEAQLASEELSAYLPSDLIMDGGAVFYQVMAMGDRPPMPPPPRPMNPPPPTFGDLRVPEVWTRADIERSGLQAKLRKEEPREGKRVKARIQYFQRGNLNYKDPATGQKMAKRFGEVFSRSFQFAMVDGKPKVVGVSPINIESNGGVSGLAIARGVLFLPDGSARSLFDGLDRIAAPEAMPVLPSGRLARLEVEATSGMLAYAYLNGPGGGHRFLMTAENSPEPRPLTRYTAQLPLPIPPGPYHLGIELMDPGTFRPGPHFRAHAVGVSFRVAAPAAP